MQPTKSEFVEACKLVQMIQGDVRTALPRHKFRKDPARAIDLLIAIRDSMWPESDRDEVRFSPEMLRKPRHGTMIHYAYDANILLEEASRSSDQPRKLYITTHDGGGSFSIAWQPTAPKSQGDRIFKSVVLLGKFIRDNHTSHFMRGVQSMARDLGVGLSDRRGLRSAYEDFAVGGLGTILGTGARRLDPDRHSVLLVFEDPDRVEIMKSRLADRNFHVITTGYRDGDITAKHADLASRLAERAMSDLKSSCAANRNKIILVTFSEKGTNHVYSVRTEAIREAFRRAREFRIEPLDLGSDPFVDADIGTARDKAKRFQELLRERLTPDVIAFFGRTDRITIEAVDFVFENNLDIDIYTEIITQGTLLRLADSNSRLRAVCGTDPYFHGRYALRAASCSIGDRYGYAKIDPILISKSVAMRDDIFTFDRIPNVFEGNDVNLNGSKYAWANWMSERSPSSYGPNIRLH